MGRPEYVARISEKWNACAVLVGRSQRNRSLGRQRDRLVDNIKMDLREVK
jgi:hypothetical protein